MDDAIRVPKKLRGIRSESDDSVFEIGHFYVRALDRFSNEDMNAILPPFWEYWFRVNNEDLSYDVDESLYGQPFKMPMVERVIYGYLASGFGIQMLFDPKADPSRPCVGFLLSRIVCDLVLEIRALYIDSGLFNKGLGKGLVDSLQKPINRVIFQTRKDNPPSQFLSISKPYRRQIGQMGLLITWEMDWRS